VRSKSRRQVQPRARHKLIRSGTAAVVAAIVFGAMGVRSASAQHFSWRDAVSGNWTSTTRWSNVTPPNTPGVPDSPGESASIGVISLTGNTYTVTLNSSIDIAGLTFSSNHGTLALGAAGGAPITVKTGYLTLDGRAVVVNGDAAFQVPFASHLDLERSNLRRDLPDAAAAEAQLREYERLIASARNSVLGEWRGPGITSSIAAQNAGPVTVGAGLVGTSMTGVLVTYTYDGDANLYGRINADDYFRIDSGFLA
jgi:hypothetical protein